MTELEYEKHIGCYRKELENYILSKTQNNYDLTQEIVQHSLIKAFKYCKLSQDIKTYKNWLYQIATNTLIDYCRKKNKSKVYSLIFRDDENFAEFEVQDKFCYDKYEDKLIINKIINDGLNAMEQYNKNLHATLIKSLQCDNYQEIANEENIPLSTVKTRVHRARKFMQKFLEENDCTL